FAAHQVFVSRVGSEAEERAALVASEGARDGTPTLGGDPIEDAPFRIDAQEGILLENAGPHRALAIEADAIGFGEAAEAFAHIERAIGSNREFRETISIAFGHYESLAGF